MVKDKDFDFNDSIDSPDNKFEFDEKAYKGSNLYGESIPDKPTIDKFYDTENILYSIEQTFRGYQKKQNRWVYRTRPIARDEFINQLINSLRSVMNPENIISKKTAEEVEIILLEKNMEIIDLCEDEITLDDDYFESTVNICDHALEIFMGLVQGGHGAQTLKEIYAGVANSMNSYHDNEQNGAFQLRVGDKELISLGKNKT